MNLFGIDVSYAQGQINWKQVKDSGVEFAILRAGFGKVSSQKDKQFEHNYIGAKEAKIPIGAYHYSYALSTAQAKQEAEVLLGWLKGKEFEYPIFFDIEDPSMQHLGKQTLTEMVKVFCEQIKAAGYQVGVYANKYWFTNLLDFEQLQPYPIWLAQYHTTPTFQGKYDIWQYSSTGKIAGINGNVDVNYCYTDLQTKPQTGWIQQDGKWWYRHTDGSYIKDGWEQINEKWYYFDHHGWMKTGWVLHKENWYYLAQDGTMQTGWQEIDGRWYYLNPSSGEAFRGTHSIDGKSYHFAYRAENGLKECQWIEK